MKNFKLYKGKLTILNNIEVLFLEHDKGSYILISYAESGGDTDITDIIPEKDLKLLSHFIKIKKYYHVDTQQVYQWLNSYKEISLFTHNTFAKLEIL